MKIKIEDEKKLYAEQEKLLADRDNINQKIRLIEEKLNCINCLVCVGWLNKGDNNDK